MGRVVSGLNAQLSSFLDLFLLLLELLDPRVERIEASADLVGVTGVGFYVE